MALRYVKGFASSANNFRTSSLNAATCCHLVLTIALANKLARIALSVSLANKLARIALSVLIQGRSYETRIVSAAA
jgi:hypothetical protein